MASYPISWAGAATVNVGGNAPSGTASSGAAGTPSSPNGGTGTAGDSEQASPTGTDPSNTSNVAGGNGGHGGAGAAAGTVPGSTSGGSGGMGGTGGSASVSLFTPTTGVAATAIANANPAGVAALGNAASAGGAGGAGGSAGLDGAGGNGGAASADAFATANQTTTAVSSTANAAAIGGAGGAGGYNALDTVAGVAGAAGGTGGNASALTQAHGSGDIITSATSIGGAGGAASGTGAVGGTGGTATATAGGNSSEKGAVTVSTSITGGAGGSGLLGAAGGAGVSLAQSNSATGTSGAGPVTLSQSVTGGAGGSSAGANGGLGGSANSVLTNEMFGQVFGVATAVAQATGGAGGDALSNGAHAFGGNGGAASVTADQNAVAPGVVSMATATGGNGGRGDFGGAGGIASGTAYSFTPEATSTSTLNLIGGNGGGGYVMGGTGAAESQYTNGNLSAPTPLVILQNVTGGNAGAALSVGANPGQAGDAVSELSAGAVMPNGSTAGSTTLNLSAVGGSGGNVMTGNASNGGNATAQLEVQLQQSSVTAHLLAVGGSGGTAGSNGAAGHQGVGLVETDAESSTVVLLQGESKGANAMTRVNASAPAGSAYTVYSSGTSFGGTPTGTTFSGGDIPGDAAAEAAITNSTPRLPSDGSPAQAFTSTESLPTATDVLAATVHDPTARSAFTTGATNNLALTAVNDAGLAGAAPSISFVENEIMVSSTVAGDLHLGLLNGAYTGTGNAEITVDIDGQQALSLSYDSYAELAAAFDDVVFDLGTFQPDKAGYYVAIDVQLSVIPSDATSQFSGDLILATNVPEPIALPGVGLVVALTTGRRRRTMRNA